MNDMSLGHLLAERARLSPHKEGMVDEGERYSFADLNQRADKFAAHLQSAGVARGDRIAVVARNSEMHATTVMAAAKIGAIAVVVNWRLAAPEVEHIFQDSGPLALVYQSEFSTLLGKVSRDVRPTVLISDTASNLGTDTPTVYSEVMDRSDAATTPVTDSISAEDPVVLMYTSGTTGRSKGAVLTHANLYTAAHSSSCTIDWSANQRFLLGAPMFHIGGLFYLFGNIMRGTTTVMLPDFQPGLTWQMIEDEKITTMMTVPAMLRAMFAAPQISTVDRSRLEYLICGGSAVSSDLVREGAEHGIDVQIVYGATEFTGPITFWVHADDPDGIGSAGRVIMNAELDAFDPNSHTRLPAGQDGEIWLRGPMTFDGYWRNPQATNEVLVDGWYRTGDVGSVDTEGRVHLKDRLKDVIISGGENIYPAEIESVLNAHDSVLESAVVGKPDERWGEVPVAFIVPTPGANPSEEEIIAHVKKNLASFKVVKEVIFYDALPVNAVGKILRRKLRANS